MKFKRLSETAKLPTKGTTNSAGWDIYSDETKTIHYNSKELISTNLSYEIPSGYVLVIKDRSSVANKDLTTNAGVLDSDYRGNIKVMLRNNTGHNLHINKGDKIAQFLLLAVPEAEVVESNELKNSERGIGGFGSTDKTKV